MGITFAPSKLAPFSLAGLAFVFAFASSGTLHASEETEEARQSIYDPGRADPHFAFNPREGVSQQVRAVGSYGDGMGAYGVGSQISGKIGASALNDSVAWLELLGGQPVLRIRGSTELFPINVLQNVDQNYSFFAVAANALLLNVIPLTAEGNVAFSKLASDAMGTARLTVSPEFAAKYIVIAGNGLEGIALTAELRAGFAGVYFRNQREEAISAGPSLAAKSSLSMLFDYERRFSFDIAGRLVPLIDSDAAAVQSGSLGAQGSQLLESGQHVYLRAELRHDQGPTLAKDGLFVPDQTEQSTSFSGFVGMEF